MAAGGLRVCGVKYCIQAVALLLLLCYGNCDEMECLEVKTAYTEKGFDGNEVPVNAIPGDPLDICSKQETCCTQTMEEKLQSLSKEEHTKQLNKAYKVTRRTFASRIRKFDKIFSGLFEKARRDFHEVFRKTYGLIYTQSKRMYNDLFDGLEGYYKGKNNNLNAVLETFFRRLFQKMIELLNAQYRFDAPYRACLANQIDELKPFGDIQYRLSVQVRRSFNAARTLVYGLATGRNVIARIKKVPATDQCTRGLMKMMYCPYCQGLINTKPCNNFCLNTMKGCLAYQADINSVWKKYIEAMEMLAGRLEAQYSVEPVLESIDVRISDAIMTLQENSYQVSTRIFAECGKPKFNRKKRDTADYTFNRLRVRRATVGGTSMDKLVRNIRKRLKKVKVFWEQLPSSICNDEDVSVSTLKQDCWNGQELLRYNPEVEEEGLIPEVKVNGTNTIVSNQIRQLQLITARLRSAFNGIDGN